MQLNRAVMANGIPSDSRDSAMYHTASSASTGSE